jgi:hypothetical protein
LENAEGIMQMMKRQTRNSVPPDLLMIQERNNHNCTHTTALIDENDKDNEHEK